MVEASRDRPWNTREHLHDYFSSRLHHNSALYFTIAYEISFKIALHLSPIVLNQHLIKAYFYDSFVLTEVFKTSYSFRLTCDTFIKSIVVARSSLSLLSSCDPAIDH
jgi:hypothetical protein